MGFRVEVSLVRLPQLKHLTTFWGVWIESVMFQGAGGGFRVESVGYEIRCFRRKRDAILHKAARAPVAISGTNPRTLNSSRRLG